jgi:hypothetical protein
MKSKFTIFLSHHNAKQLCRESHIAFLGREGVLLKEAWDQFCQALPAKSVKEFEQRPPTFDDVLQVVYDYEAEWQGKRTKGKFGVALGYLKKVCKTLDSHSYMLEVLPVGNEYVSLFTGTLKSVIKVCLFHYIVCSNI